MAICTFVGHNALYDDDIYKRTVGAAFEVAKQNDTVEFQFFWKGKHSFSRISLVAALDAFSAKRDHYNTGHKAKPL